VELIINRGNFFAGVCRLMVSLPLTFVSLVLPLTRPLNQEFHQDQIRILNDISNFRIAGVPDFAVIIN
jgi:hypothetical protein